MKARIYPGPEESLEQAEDVLSKAIKSKKDPSGEKYADPALNELHDFVLQTHSNLISNVLSEINDEILRNAHSK